jgi:hypothetical protein
MECCAYVNLLQTKKCIFIKGSVIETKISAIKKQKLNLHHFISTLQ